MPETSENAAGIESPVPGVIVTRKLNGPYGSCRDTAIARLPLGSDDRRVGRPLADAEDDELGGLCRCDADQADQPAVIQIALAHRRAVAADEIGFLRLRTHQRAAAPGLVEETLDRQPYLQPQLLVVRLEHRPLRAVVD